MLTSSEMKTYRRCPREHHLTYRMGYRPAREADALRFGSLFHSMLEAWWAARSDALSAPAALGLSLMTLHGGDALPFEAATAEALMFGYDARWSDFVCEVVAVEQQFTTPMVNPATGARSQTWQLAGKLDAVCKVGGLTYLVEHKTTSEECGPGSDYVRRLRLDAQLSVYYAGANALGHDIAGVIYDVVRKPGLRPYQVGQRRKTAETPDEYRERVCADIAEDPDRYYQRHIVTRIGDEMPEAMADVWHLGRLISEGERLDRSPRNPDACIRYGRACSFFGVCTGEQSLDDPNHFRKATAVHEELSQENAT
jgi:hypothetical protein